MTPARPPLLRAYRPSDHDALVSLWSRCGLLRPWNDPSQDIRRKLAHDPGGLLVLEADDRLAGAVMAGYDGHRGWVNYLAVDPAYQGHGLGRLLMDEAERRLRAAGCPKVNLQVRTSNENAVAFYRHLGYDIDDVVSMGKRLLNDAAPEQPRDSAPPRPADAGPGGGAATRPEAAGSASEAAFAAVQPAHDRPRGPAGTTGCEHGRVNTPVKRLKVCLNGGRSREDHPAVPLAPVELAASAAAAVDAGAEAVHLHPRGADGGESLLAADIAAAVTAVRQACPGTPVGVSTGLWITGGDPAARQSAVAAWAALPATARPDFASVNLSEPGWEELRGVLAWAGIAAEAGIWSVADTDQLAAAGQAAGWLRILVEIINVPAGEAVAAADEVLHRLDELNATIPRLLHGEGQACWPLIAHAGTLGLPTRIGLEDTTVGPDGTAVSGNAELVQLALQIWRTSTTP
jgi:uncharacterized protein (DUF849 family)/ribosomal protein S18 acetylase RimI-like enzyme